MVQGLLGFRAQGSGFSGVRVQGLVRFSGQIVTLGYRGQDPTFVAQGCRELT